MTKNQSINYSVQSRVVSFVIVDHQDVVVDHYQAGRPIELQLLNYTATITIIMFILSQVVLDLLQTYSLKSFATGPWENK